MTITKRSGQRVEYDISKIQNAVFKALAATDGVTNPTSEQKARYSAQASIIAKSVENAIPTNNESVEITVEQIQNLVEITLMKLGYVDTAKLYILYRKNREAIRSINQASDSALIEQLKAVISTDANDLDDKRSNANVDGDTPMGTMLQAGSAASIAFYKAHLLSEEQNAAHTNGDIHIHDLDFLALTLTCCQIDIEKLFKDGFSTGHGFLREPSVISSYAALAAIAIQSNQNDQHGGQSIPNFDRAMAHGVRLTYKKEFKQMLTYLLNDMLGLSEDDAERVSSDCISTAESVTKSVASMDKNDAFDTCLLEDISEVTKENSQVVHDVIKKAHARAFARTNRQTYQAMEAFIHNLNTMHSRAGAQVPFSSINYGTDTSSEARMIVKNLLLTTEDGLGNHETPIFPIQVFRVKEGINYNPGDPNYDLFKLSLRVTAKRLFPNYSFQDASFNLPYYDPSRPETEIATMGCRTRVMANVHDPDNQISYSRGNLSFTTINLPRLAIEAKGNEEAFFDSLGEKMELVKQQLLDRFEIQANRKVRNFPFLMGEGVWLGSDKLGPDDTVREVIKHGTLSIGFIGLAETLTSLYGAHHGESDLAQEKGLKIVQFMRDLCDEYAQSYKLNFSLLATPAEGLSGRFTKIDQKKYGIIKGVTDREYYTNSFHVPVHYNTTFFHKIDVEAPYHALTNAGHITYIEFDGDPSQNIEALETIVRYMKEHDIGYGAINHPVDRDVICGYTGVIKETCPGCNRDTRDGKNVEYIRRITGYLAGTLDRFNDAKKAEERDRVKHTGL